MKIGFVPIDNRPVCYTLPKMIAEIDDDLQLFLPDRELLGDLVKSANIQNIFKWLENLPQLDALIISLDTLIYGGLIPSRRCNDTPEELLFRINRLENILKSQNTKVFAFSSIMRISNNNINEEEKEYWSKFGKKIFDYSYKTHKYGKVENTDIPKEILEDYLNTRKRNFEINKIFL